MLGFRITPEFESTRCEMPRCGAAVRIVLRLSTTSKTWKGHAAMTGNGKSERRGRWVEEPKYPRMT